MIYSGIYKWTNPKGRVYVGQSEDLLDNEIWNRISYI